MNIPGWYALLLLAASSYRVWHLIGIDTILDRPRKRATKALRHLGEKFDTFLLCGWCAGFWVSLVWWGAWQAWPHATLVVAVPFAISAAVGLASKLD